MKFFIKVIFWYDEELKKFFVMLIWMIEVINKWIECVGEKIGCWY